MLAGLLVQRSMILIKEYGPRHGEAYGRAPVQFGVLKGISVMKKVCGFYISGTKPVVYYPL